MYVRKIYQLWLKSPRQNIRLSRKIPMITGDKRSSLKVVQYENTVYEYLEVKRLDFEVGS